MIEKIKIRGYRKYRDETVIPHPGFNIIVGENEGGKSTFLEAVGLALTGRVNGRPASEELNPYWFNRAVVAEFFRDRKQGKPVALPTISIEVFLADREEFQRNLFGAHNSEIPTQACPGVCLTIEPNPEYAVEIDEHLQSDSTLLPVDYYMISWKTFGDKVLTARPRELTTAIIDGRTIRSTSSVDFHLRQILSDHLEPQEKAAVAIAFRNVKEKMTADHLTVVNDKMALLEGALDGQPLSLEMDQTSRTSWDASVVPHVADVPFGMAGQGQQAAIKIALAMDRNAATSRVIMVEEPENHLSHTSLNKLLNRIEQHAGKSQLFVTTHSSFVLNRLGLNSLIFVTNGTFSSMKDLEQETVDYFRKLPGYDTLRMVLAEKFVLVEGPSDEIVFERAYIDTYGHRPIEDGIDVVSMRGLSLGRCLALAKALGKNCAALRDNDGEEPTALVDELGELVLAGTREVFIGAVSLGATLEPQLLSHNEPDVMRNILGVTNRADLGTWMKNNKTEGALRIAGSATAIVPPAYIAKAIKFIHDVK